MLLEDKPIQDILGSIEVAIRSVATAPTPKELSCSILFVGKATHTTNLTCVAWINAVVLDSNYFTMLVKSVQDSGVNPSLVLIIKLFNMSFTVLFNAFEIFNNYSLDWS